MLLSAAMARHRHNPMSHRRSPSAFAPSLASPRGCCHFALVVGLSLAAVGTLSFGTSRLLLAIENPRAAAVRDYNAAVHAWVAPGGGREVFAATSRATALVVNGTRLQLVPRNGTVDDVHAEPPLLDPAAGGLH